MAARKGDTMGTRTAAGVAIGLLALSAACGPSYRYAAAADGGEGLPRWAVTGQSDAWPREAFVTGLGRGQTQEMADDLARAEIAKVFEVEVHATTAQVETYGEASNSAGAYGWEKSADVTQAVESETRKTLSGVEVVDRFPGRGTYASYAVLDRAKASATLHARASDLAARARALWDEAGATPDPMVAARDLYQASVALARLESVNADLRVLGVRGPVSGPVRASEAFAAFKDRVRRDLPISVSVAGDGAGRVQAAVKSALSARGIEVVATGAKVAIAGTCPLKPIDRGPPGWFWVHWDLVLEARDVATGTTLAAAGPVSEDSSGRTGDQASDRAAWTVVNRHVEPFLKVLFERLFGAGAPPEAREVK